MFCIPFHTVPTQADKIFAVRRELLEAVARHEAQEAIRHLGEVQVPWPDGYRELRATLIDGELVVTDTSTGAQVA